MPIKGNSKLSMHLTQRINAFVRLGYYLKQMASEKRDVQAETILTKTEAANGWFTKENLKFSLHNWGEALSESNLQQWVANYQMEAYPPKTIGVVMAGNVPLVGFHDFLSVLITGNRVLAKLSSNDRALLPFLAQKLIALEPGFEDHIRFTEEKISNFDAVIATGSNNTARYFEYYFGKHPNIIRKNRNSIAILSGNETDRELNALADDIFRYFGLGCRNVSKIYVPENYDFKTFFKAMFHWKKIIHNHKYMNNYDYNKAVYLMDGLPLLDNGYMVLKEDNGFSSPISVVFYEKYAALEELKEKLEQQSENIQCIVSNLGLANEISFGKAQTPALLDYADGIDTVNFLLKLH